MLGFGFFWGVEKEIGLVWFDLVWLSFPLVFQVSNVLKCKKRISKDDKTPGITFREIFKEDFKKYSTMLTGISPFPSSPLILMAIIYYSFL